MSKIEHVHSKTCTTVPTGPRLLDPPDDLTGLGAQALRAAAPMQLLQRSGCCSNPPTFSLSLSLPSTIG